MDRFARRLMNQGWAKTLHGVRKQVLGHVPRRRMIEDQRRGERCTNLPGQRIAELNGHERIQTKFSKRRVEWDRTCSKRECACDICLHHLNGDFDALLRWQHRKPLRPGAWDSMWQPLLYESAPDRRRRPRKELS